MAAKPLSGLLIVKLGGVSMNSQDRPYTPRGRLRNNNPPGDFTKAPRCMARTRRGNLCHCPAMKNRKRCRLHGGLSTGPRTPEGRERSRLSRLKHGLHSSAEVEFTELIQSIIRKSGELIEAMTSELSKL